MDKLQEQQERGIADAFFGWYNGSHGTHFLFSHRAEIAPDLIYRDGTTEVLVEIAEGYYDTSDARFKWENARERASAPKVWSGVNFTEALVLHINEILERKCRNTYGTDCLLIVHVHPAATPASFFEAHLRQVRLPGVVPFVGVYLTATLGNSINDRGGYRCYPLKPWRGNPPP